MTPTDSDEPGSVVTFYSYKGGTGRTMALANVACLLASGQTATGGKPVLAVDWDLEAPGLHRYFQPYLRADDSRPGVIDLMTDVRSRLETLPPGDGEEERARSLVEGIDLSRYVTPTAYPSLSFLKAGRFDNPYSERVNTFPWQSFFHSVPSFYRLFAARLSKEYSWVLLDSRTGLTDISGVCTMLMPEKLVVVFTPNKQSLTGIVDLVRRATEYRRGSDDLRPLVIYPLPSRIETSVQPLAQAWRLGDPSQGIDGWQDQFIAVFREVYDLDETFTLERYFDEVQLQHVAPYSYGEPLPVTEERGSDRLTLTKSYETFRSYLTLDAPWSERSEPVADTHEVRKQVERLNEAVRTQRESVMLPARVRNWVDEHRALTFAIAAFLLLVVVGFETLRRQSDQRERSLRLLASTLRDAQQNPDAVTALLLERAVKGLSGDDRSLALQQLGARLARMPQQSKRIPVNGSVSRISLSADGAKLLMVSGSELALSVRDLESGAAPVLYARNITNAQFFGKDGSVVATAATPHEFRLWSPAARVTKTFPLSGEDLALSGSGRYVSVYDEGNVLVYELDPSAPGLKLLLRRAIRGASGFRPDAFFEGDLISVWNPEQLMIGKLKNGTWMDIPLQTSVGYYTVMASGLVAIAEENLQLWQLAGLTPHRLGIVPLKVTAVIISPEGDRLAAILESGSLIVSRIPRSAKLEQGVPIERERKEPVSQLFWIGDHIVARGQNWIEVFDVDHLDKPPLSFEAILISDFAVHEDVMAVATQEDRSSAVVLLNIGPLPDVAAQTDEARRKLVCSRAGRDLTPEEWTAYLGDRKYERTCDEELFAN